MLGYDAVPVSACTRIAALVLYPWGGMEAAAPAAVAGDRHGHGYGHRHSVRLPVLHAATLFWQPSKRPLADQ